MAKVTKEYLHEHRHLVHTFESFGRAVIEQVLDSAEKQVSSGSVDQAKVNASFEISAYESRGCVQVCVNISGVMVCYHVG